MIMGQLRNRGFHSKNNGIHAIYFNEPVVAHSVYNCFMFILQLLYDELFQSQIIVKS